MGQNTTNAEFWGELEASMSLMRTIKEEWSRGAIQPFATTPECPPGSKMYEFDPALHGHKKEEWINMSAYLIEMIKDMLGAHNCVVDLERGAFMFEIGSARTYPLQTMRSVLMETRAANPNGGFLGTRSGNASVEFMAREVAYELAATWRAPASPAFWIEPMVVEKTLFDTWVGPPAAAGRAPAPQPFWIEPMVVENTVFDTWTGPPAAAFGPAVCVVEPWSRDCLSRGFLRVAIAHQPPAVTRAFRQRCNDGNSSYNNAVILAGAHLPQSARLVGLMFRPAP